MQKGDRSFTLVKVVSGSKGKKTKTGGRYVAKTPDAAAKKAFTRECRTSKIKGVCTHIISLKETTSGSKGKVYQYKVKRSLLKPALKVMRGDKEITIRYKVSAKSAKVSKKMKGGGKKTQAAIQKAMEKMGLKNVEKGIVKMIDKKKDELEKSVKEHYKQLMDVIGDVSSDVADLESSFEDGEYDDEDDFISDVSSAMYPFESLLYKIMEETKKYSKADKKKLYVDLEDYLQNNSPDMVRDTFWETVQTVDPSIEKLF